jgi:hypothetical protein
MNTPNILMPDRGLLRSTEVKATPEPDLELDLIMDNYGTHQHEKVRRFLDRHPRFKVHYIFGLIGHTDDGVIPKIGTFGITQPVRKVIRKSWTHPRSLPRV